MAIKGIQFISDAKGKKTGVLIDLRRNERLWEDLFDLIVAGSRDGESRSTWKLVERKLRMRSAKRVDRGSEEGRVG